MTCSEKEIPRFQADANYMEKRNKGRSIRPRLVINDEIAAWQRMRILTQSRDDVCLSGGGSRQPANSGKPQAGKRGRSRA